ncbi:hypothetical protein V2I01_38490 [Micromonospora sp. BRA006-A]|nr:hypothetical protein [Micromonospora sp. BRA006-A]
MIRLTLRQFRLPALVGAVLLVLAGSYLLRLGADIRAVPDPPGCPAGTRRRCCSSPAGSRWCPR